MKYYESNYGVSLNQVLGFELQGLWGLGMSELESAGWLEVELVVKFQPGWGLEPELEGLGLFRIASVFN